MDTVSELLERAELQGYLTSSDILEVLPEAEDSLEQLEEIFISLHELGIEVYEDDIEVEDDVDAVDEDDAEEEFYDLSNISADDTVGLYLKEMARVPLLTTEEEVRLARMVEAGRDAQRLIRDNGHDPIEACQLEGIIEQGVYAREHLIELENNYSDSVYYVGQAAWTQLPDGEVYVVTGKSYLRDDEQRGSVLRGCYLREEDFGL